jgi:hypothetical protein
MNALSNSLKQESNITYTENGMPAYESTLDSNLDLFANIVRGTKISNRFDNAYSENRELSLRLAQYILDVRQGQGERELFLQIISYLNSKGLVDDASILLHKIPELGNFKLLREIAIMPNISPDLYMDCVNILASQAFSGNQLAFKWIPSPATKSLAKYRVFTESLKQTAKLNNLIPNLSDKEFRKFLSKNRVTVEKQLCSKEVGKINYSGVPSLAHKKYKKTFYKQDKERYEAYVESLTDPNSKNKVNASVLYPYDVLEEYLGKNSTTSTEDKLIEAQWLALPDYMNDVNILPMVDVSGSMESRSGVKNLTVMDIAISLGLYTANKSKGAFKDQMITFTDVPKIFDFSNKESIRAKVKAIQQSPVGYNTDFVAAFDELLTVAVDNNVSQEDMPTHIVAFSDMQFDEAQSNMYSGHTGKKQRMSRSAFSLIKKKFKEAGYETPTLIFWNLADKGNVPVTKHESGAMLVSGYSPVIMKNILSGNFENLTPQSLMLDKLMSDRYAI